MKRNKLHLILDRDYYIKRKTDGEIFEDGIQIDIKITGAEDIVRDGDLLKSLVLGVWGLQDKGFCFTLVGDRGE